MKKYNDLNDNQKTLVDITIALNIGKMIGLSAEIPDFITHNGYVETLRDTYSESVHGFERGKETIYLEAKNRGIDPARPEEYINKAIEAVRKMSALNSHQIVYTVPKNHSQANAISYPAGTAA